MSAPSKEQFCQSLNADAWCGWDWCRKLYGYSVTDPTILERVFARLDELNRPMVKHIYAFYIKTQIAHEIERTKDAGAWLVEQTDKNYERQVKEWQKYQERLHAQNLSDEELMSILKRSRKYPL